MTELLTAARMRAVEEAAMTSGKVTGPELMERAGRGVVEAVFEEWPDLAATSHRAVVLCGPGNNGGDGFVVARLLHERGWDVELFLFGDPEKLPPDAKTNCARWAQMGAVGDMIRDIGHGCAPHLLVDAVFGTGLSRPVEGRLAQVLATFDGFRDSQEGRTVAVDVPSGLCADSGRALGACARADLTVTFHAAKPGHHLSRGPHQSGKLRVKGIGLEPGAGADDVVRLVERPCSGHLEKRAERHKYGHGHALVLSGGAGRTGAARLAARGALRIGAGLVTLGVPPSAQMEAACQVTSIMLARVVGGDGLADVLQDERLSAVCLGPGLGVERALELVPVALARGGVEPRPTVLDADALTAFAEAPDELFGMLHAACVLTPHGGEFARLFPDIVERLDATPVTGPAYSKVDATRDAAARAGCVVLFKGADTVIAAPDGRCSINSAQYDRAAPWLATAGAGDVLTGFIAGLLARGVEPMQAAEAAAWLHVECARSFGPGLIAEDLPEELPKVLRDVAG
ncbi:NAD(P)H-hydrate dehydratase [Roseovarius sp.]|uniref:NAD(P)H-hydrate dehydratase n=1 Tax=Roseovarius sp. TaxID=1486281 RepID=UPI003D0DBE90